MNTKFLAIACIALFTLAACKPDPAEPVATAPAAAEDASAGIDVISSGQAVSPEAASAFDQRSFAGTFTGTLPCASCPGIDTTLVLNPDGSYQITEVYQDDKDATSAMDGSWTAEADNQQIRLDPNSKTEQDRLFAITSQQQITQLDLEGKPAESGLDYTLSRQSAN